MRDLIILVVLLAFILPGLTRPYMAFAGYLWADLVVPQGLVFGFLAGKPISMIMALVCFLSLLLAGKKLRFPLSKSIPVLFVIFLSWITLTTLHARFPMAAWIKWDPSFKTLLMAFLLMFTITTCKQLEFVVLVFFCSIMFYMASAGPKTILSGGGYGARLILNGSNFGLSESSTLACVAVMTLPIILYLNKHISLMPFLKNKKIIWLLTGILCITTVVGTTARTGLVALVAYIGIRSFNLRNMIKLLPLVLIAAVVISQVAPQSWFERMGNTTASQRVAVWQWTMDYVADKPLMGGGFQSYLDNAGELGQYDDKLADFVGVRAFHSIYFEVLGEHGYVGLLIFLGLIIAAVRLNHSLIKRHDIDDKTKDFCLAMNHAIYIYCIGGLFIGVAFKPIIYQLIAISAAHHTIANKEFDEKAIDAKKL